MRQSRYGHCQRLHSSRARSLEVCSIGCAFCCAFCCMSSFPANMFKCEMRGIYTCFGFFETSACRHVDVATGPAQLKTWAVRRAGIAIRVQHFDGCITSPFVQPQQQGCPRLLRSPTTTAAKARSDVLLALEPRINDESKTFARSRPFNKLRNKNQVAAVVPELLNCYLL